MFSRIFATILLLVLSREVIAQNDLENYIPTSDASYITHPEIEIRTIIHIIKRFDNDPQNLSEDSLAFIKEQFRLVNAFYKDLENPTLPTADGIEHYVKSARIQFRVDNILFHTSAEDWDRIKIYESKNIPMQVMGVVENTNELIIKNRRKSFMSQAKDSVKIIIANGDSMIYHFTAIQEKDGNSYFRMKEKVDTSMIDAVLTSYREENLNCSLDLWEKYTNSDKTSLHVFYTGSSKSTGAFGCGPTFYYLNVSNIIRGGGWAGAQLTAHELGHTIGLSHTDRPQFDDLPATDKFGFIMCDANLTSNNIMGYNQCRRYLSPKQIGYVHQLYSTRKDHILLTTANEYDSYAPVELWEDTQWNKAMVIKKDIVIRRGQTLTLSNQLHMAAGAKIYVEKKAKLIVDGAEITNFFDTNWGGVIICRSYERKTKQPRNKKKYGVIEIKNEGALNNCP